MTTLIVGENIYRARDAMQQIVLTRALRPGARGRLNVQMVYGRGKWIDRGMIGNEDFVVLDARRPDMLLQADLNAVGRVLTIGRMPLVMKWVIAGIRFNNGIGRDEEESRG